MMLPQNMMHALQSLLLLKTLLLTRAESIFGAAFAAPTLKAHSAVHDAIWTSSGHFWAVGPVQAFCFGTSSTFAEFMNIN